MLGIELALPQLSLRTVIQDSIGDDVTRGGGRRIPDAGTKGRIKIRELTAQTCLAQSDGLLVAPMMRN